MLLKNYKKSELINGSDDLSHLNNILGESIYINMSNIKYFHNVNPDDGVYLDISCDIHEAQLTSDMFELNGSNITYKYPVITNTLNISIDECTLCDTICETPYKFELKVGDTIDLGVCPYYSNAATKIQKKWRLIKNKSPEDIIDKIDLS